MFEWFFCITPIYIFTPLFIKTKNNMNTKETNKETQAMNKIVLYGFNYENNFIELVWGVETPLTKHFESKFREAGTFFNFYMQLSETNKDLLNNHILNTNL